MPYRVWAYGTDSLPPSLSLSYLVINSCINPHQQLIQKLREHFSGNMWRSIETANIFLFVVVEVWQAFNRKADIFVGHGAIKWVYYGCEVCCTLAHLMIMKESSSARVCLHLKNVSGSLGFELVLWRITGHLVWILINLCMLASALLCSAGPELLEVLKEIIQPLDDDPFSEVRF